MLRAVVAIFAVLVLSSGTASAEGLTPEAVPLELQWLKVVAQIISTVGMPGVIAGLLYLLKLQKADREKEAAGFKAELIEERAYIKKLQADRIDSAAASADRLATVAVSSANAITTAAEKNAGLHAVCQEIKESVGPVDGELSRILSNQDGLFAAVNAVALKVANGCRAP